jgi:hypothetical protein
MFCLILMNMFLFFFCRFTKDAIKEEDEILGLPTNLRISAFEKMRHRFVGKEKAAMSNNVFTGTSIDEEQELQVSCLSRMIRNNHHKSYPLYAI